MVSVLISTLLSVVNPTTLPAAVDTLRLSTSDQHHLFVPHEVRIERGTVDVHVHLKGSPGPVVEAVQAVSPGTIVIIVTEPGLSKAYSGPFSDPVLLQRMLDESLQQVRRRDDVPDDARLGRLTIASFSAGYGAVRELLKHDTWFEQIDGILFLDSIYAGYVSEEDRTPVPGQMVDFCRFAHAAAAGEKVMIVTHTSLMPGSYASTGETADVILKSIGLPPAPHEEQLADGLTSYRVAEAKGFFLVGTRGDTGDEHGRVLANARLWLPRLFNKD
jgi:hypothetical protein